MNGEQVRASGTAAANGRGANTLHREWCYSGNKFENYAAKIMRSGGRHGCVSCDNTGRRSQRHRPARSELRPWPCAPWGGLPAAPRAGWAT